MATTVETVQASIEATMSMKEFATQFDIIKASPVRVNANDYPFITFLQSTKGVDGKNLAENVYFSKKAALLVKEGDEPTVCKANGFVVLELLYPNGERRLKISLRGGEGEYSNIDDLF